MFNKKLVTIIDKENSMYVGELVTDHNNDYIIIKNPVGIAYPRDASGNVSIAVVPVIYEGFLSENAIKKGTDLNFYRSSIKWFSEEVDYHPDFIAKYHSIFQAEEKK